MHKNVIACYKHKILITFEIPIRLDLNFQIRFRSDFEFPPLTAKEKWPWYFIIVRTAGAFAFDFHLFRTMQYHFSDQHFSSFDIQKIVPPLGIFKRRVVLLPRNLCFSRKISFFYAYQSYWFSRLLSSSKLPFASYAYNFLLTNRPDMGVLVYLDLF